jgi:hypothetical protein
MVIAVSEAYCGIKIRMKLIAAFEVYYGKIYRDRRGSDWWSLKNHSLRLHPQ